MLQFGDSMGVIVLEGVVVTVLVLAGFREAVMKAVPNSLELAIAVGIGLFILFIGFVNGGLIEAGEGTPVQFVFPPRPDLGPGPAPPTLGPWTT